MCLNFCLAPDAYDSTVYRHMATSVALSVEKKIAIRHRFTILWPVQLTFNEIQAFFAICEPIVAQHTAACSADFE